MSDKPENKEFTHQEFDINGSKYIYDIRILSARRIFIAKTLFQIHQKLLLNMPATVEEMKLIMRQESESRAFAAMLVKVTPTADGGVKYAPYEPFAPDTVDVLDEIQGPDELNRLEECRLDFFMRTQLQLIESMMLSADIMRSLESVKDKRTLYALLEAATKVQPSGLSNSEKPKKSANKPSEPASPMTDTTAK